MSEDVGRDEERDVDPPPLLYDAVDQPLARRDCCKEKWQRRLRSLPWINSAFSGLLLLATVMQAVLLIYHWNVMRDDLAVSRESVNEMRRTVNVSRKSNRILRNAIETENRSWIMPIGVEKTPQISSSFPTKIPIIVKNVGKAPAANVRIRSDSGESPIGAGFDPECRDFESLPSRSVLGPGATEEAGPTIKPMSFEDMERFRTSKARLYIYGHGVYDDVFRKSRVFTYCMYWTPIQENWSFCQDFNESP